MGEIRTFEDLLAWQRAVAVANLVYEVTRAFPKDEVFGLRSQLRRAAVSIACNIAEGRGRGSRADFLRFLYISRGSLFEVRTLIRIGEDQGLLSRDDGMRCHDALGECGRLLGGLIRRLEHKGRGR